MDKYDNFNIVYIAPSLIRFTILTRFQSCPWTEPEYSQCFAYLNFSWWLVWIYEGVNCRNGIHDILLMWRIQIQRCEIAWVLSHTNLYWKPSDTIFLDIGSNQNLIETCTVTVYNWSFSWYSFNNDNINSIHIQYVRLSINCFNHLVLI